MQRPSRATIVKFAIAAALLLASVAFLPTLGDQGREATVLALFDEALGPLEKSLKTEFPGEGDLHRAVLVAKGDAPEYLRFISSRLGGARSIEIGSYGKPLVVDLDLDSTPARLSLVYGPATGHPASSEATRAPIQPWSVLPPLLAIILAFATRRLVFSLLAAIMSGALLSVGFNPLVFVPHAAKSYLWDATLTDSFKLWILVFTSALIGLIQLANRAGGVQGIVDRIATLAKSARSTMVATVAMGLAIFFDDYANTILVGTTMRPLTDRMRISREKLAYLVDSTSAPIAGVAIISTWIGYEVGLFTDLSQSLGLEQDGYSMFFSALPFRFYCLFTLAFLPLLLFFGRDYGPMLRAERRAHETGAVLREGATALSAAGLEKMAAKEGLPHRAHIALVPIGVVLLGTFFGLMWDGGGFARVGEDFMNLFVFSVWRDAFGSAQNSTLILAVMSLSGSAVLLLLVLGEKLLPLKEALATYGRGLVSMYMAITILVLAWAIKAVCDDVGTSYFLVAGLKDAVPTVLLPVVIFFLASIVAFATGTSWGTMGILIPTVVPLAYHLGGVEVMYVSMAAVLDGAIFGDHCSPISDTTVMSSIASGSDHLDHVRTQMPYALTTMGAASLFGYLWWAAGWPYPVGFLVGVAALAAVIRFVGRDPRAVPI